MENNIVIEQMTSKDIDGVFEVEKNCFEHHWSKDAFKKEFARPRRTVLDNAEEIVLEEKKIEALPAPKKKRIDGDSEAERLLQLQMSLKNESKIANWKSKPIKIPSSEKIERWIADGQNN